jgi:hypothetical protein
MSINSIANAAVARRSDFAPAGGPPRGYAGIALAAAMPVSLAPATGEAQPVAPGTAKTDGVSIAYNVLFAYIPTEVLTLYVALVAALHESNQNSHAQWVALWAFLIATPLVMWLAYAAKIKAAGCRLPFHPSQWPVWEMLASTMAYFAWAFALPNSPFSENLWYTSAMGTFVVLVTSAAIGLLAPLFQRQIHAPAVVQPAAP